MRYVKYQQEYGAAAESYRFSLLYPDGRVEVRGSTGEALPGMAGDGRNFRRIGGWSANAKALIEQMSAERTAFTPLDGAVYAQSDAERCLSARHAWGVLPCGVAIRMHVAEAAIRLMRGEITAVIH
jgi:hypothetical protein